MAIQSSVEADTLKSQERLRSKDRDGEHIGVIKLSKILTPQGNEVKKDLTSSSIISADSFNRPGPSSILEAMEYKSEFMQLLNINVLTNWTEDNFTLTSSGNMFSDGTESSVSIQNNPFKTKQFVAKVPITRDAARKLPRGNEGAFNFNDPMQTGAFKSLVQALLAKWPGEYTNWAFNGDTDSMDKLLKIGDGLLKKATDTYSIGSGPLSTAKIRTALKTQLDIAAATADNLKVFSPSASFNNLKNVLGAKASGLGDRIQTNTNPLIDNSEAIWVPFLASTTGLIGNIGTNGNIQGAIEDDVVIELLKVDDTYELWLYIYADIQLLEPAKALKLTNIVES